jgi:hypothetical protein
MRAFNIVVIVLNTLVFLTLGMLMLGVALHVRLGLDVLAFFA